MKRIFLLLFFVFFSPGAFVYTQVVIENNDFRLELDGRGRAVSLIYKMTGRECLDTGIKLPAFTVTQYRPYDNENQLTFVTRPTVFPCSRVSLSGDSLRVEFLHLDYVAVISLKITDHYIVFQPEYLVRKEKKLGIKFETRIDEMVFLQLPVKNMSHFGHWLNVSWDDEAAVCLLGTEVQTRIDDITENGYHLMRAGSVKDIRLTRTGAALIVSTTTDLLSHIDEVERDYGLPRGVQSRMKKNSSLSYYECRDVTRENIEEHIQYARTGGFGIMVIYYIDFAKSMGHFPWRKEYPRGMEDLKYITGKIRDAGMIPGFHIHYNKAQINDPYVTPVPDPRLNLRKIFTLARALNDTSTTIMVEENPQGITLHEGRRLLRAGNEIIEYTGYTTVSPYRFTGCKRGTLNTETSAFPKGTKCGLLDVDNWPIFIRFDQKTSIQDEVANRIAKFVKEAGFRFIYFDGAEDTNRPYWYNVSLAMKRVYDRLNPAPFFSEGACKTHYDWHILSRGNAFDTFEPEEIKEAVDKRYLPAAKYNKENFTVVNFGWVKPTPPGKNTVGLQPDMVEYIASHAAGWDSPVSLLGYLEMFKANARTEDDLAVMRLWEEAKRKKVFTETQKEQLKKAGNEFILMKNKKGEYGLYPCRQISIAENNPMIRAFLFHKGDKVWVRYWHTSGKGKLRLNVLSRNMELFDQKGKKVKISVDKQSITVPAGSVRYLVFKMDETKVTDILKTAVFLQ